VKVVDRRKVATAFEGPQALPVFPAKSRAQIIVTNTHNFVCKKYLLDGGACNVTLVEQVSEGRMGLAMRTVFDCLTSGIENA